ncbi:MAG: histidine--tRNA ligase [Vicinamibacterales bacterium]
MAMTQPARGTRDFLPADIRRREYVIGVVRDVYTRYGFEPLETPAFENIATLTGKYGDEGNKLIFKILRRGEHEGTGEADLALRYDLTVPLARVVAQYQSELPRFFKRYQIQPVWRADRPARGRFREFYQCDIDAIGSTSLVVEAELLAAVSEVLTRLGFTDFVIRLNHRQLLSTMLESLGIPAALHGDALVALDKLDKVGPQGVEQELVGRGVDASATVRCLTFLGSVAADGAVAGAVLARLRDLVSAHPAGVAAVEDLDQLVALSQGTGAAGRIRIDPSLARGLSYYTGAIMEVAVPDLAGSLGGGGRYDNLIGMFLGREIPACGFSLGLERIIVVMSERAMFPAEVSRSATDVMITFLEDACRADALALAADLRRASLAVDIYPETSRKLEKALKYASSRQVPMLAIIGPDEMARGDVTLRDLSTRNQTRVARAEVAVTIRDGLTRTGKDAE